MSYNLFLDDERYPKDVTWMDGVLYYYDKYWEVTRCYVDFIVWITQKDVPKTISFDHDLQDFDDTGREFTGMDCLKWLVEYCMTNHLSLPVCYFHTQNPVGKKNMESYYQCALENM